MNKKVEKFGIILNTPTYRTIEQRLELLKESCPSNASINLFFEQSGYNVYGTLNVKSHQFNNSISRKALTPLECLYYLESEILHLLKEWKKVRFSNEQLNNYLGEGLVKSTSF